MTCNFLSFIRDWQTLPQLHVEQIKEKHLQKFKALVEPAVAAANNDFKKQVIGAIDKHKRYSSTMKFFGTLTNCSTNQERVGTYMI